MNKMEGAWNRGRRKKMQLMSKILVIMRLVICYAKPSSMEPLRAPHRGNTERIIDRKCSSHLKVMKNIFHKVWEISYQ